jgi:uncharacterized protein YjiS (DUF1127 family)
MSMPLDVRQTAISRFLDSAVRQAEGLVDGVRTMIAEARARRAARRTTDELAQLDPAILADIGIDPATLSQGWTAVETASPHCVAMRELGRKAPRL